HLLGRMLGAEALGLLARFQQRLLQDARHVNLAPQAGLELHAGQQRQVSAPAAGPAFPAPARRGGFRAPEIPAVKLGKSRRAPTERTGRLRVYASRQGNGRGNRAIVEQLDRTPAAWPGPDPTAGNLSGLGRCWRPVLR